MLVFFFLNDILMGHEHKPKEGDILHVQGMLGFEFWVFRTNVPTTQSHCPYHPQKS
jgi:hypothetical protein